MLSTHDYHPSVVLVSSIRDEKFDTICEKKVLELTGTHVTPDKFWTKGTNFGTLEPDVRAVLVNRQSSAGAVSIFGDRIANVVTRPRESGGDVIVIIRKGDDTGLFETPESRRFREKKAEKEESGRSEPGSCWNDK